MALYVIGDLHLSFSANKPMDKFRGWMGYISKLEQNWNKKIQGDDTVVIPGDISWSMTLQDSYDDFCFLEKLPGHKLILKGNHDYWWDTRTKMETFFRQNGLNSIKIIHNNSIAVDDKVVCGTRGWMFEKGQSDNKKIIDREAQRLKTSLVSAEAGKEKIAFFHYPPVFCNNMIAEIIDLLLLYDVKRCYYGHIHDESCSLAFNGEYMGIDFRLVSSAFINFDPVKII